MTTRRLDQGGGADELLALLGVEEGLSETAARPKPTTAAPPKPTTAAPVATMLPGPPMLRDELVREILDDLRSHGIVAGNRAVEVIRAVSAMLSGSDGGRHSGECLIATIARRTGLQVKILNGTVFPDEPVD